MCRSDSTAALLAVSLLALVSAAPASGRDFILEDQAPARAATVAEGAYVATSRATDAGGQCGLAASGAGRSKASDCTACHRAIEHATHPVEMNYEASRRAGGARARDLRPTSELLKRGIRLVDGKVSCVTCHVASSQLAYNLALPPGSMARPAVNPRDRSSYTVPVAATRVDLLAPGAVVSPTSLCKACHAFD